MPFTVSKMLRLPPFQDAVVLAGSKGTGAAVSGVTMLESTDFSHAAMRGEIVLTSAFFLEVFTQNDVNYIVECQKKQAVGICIKSTGDGSELPADLLATAERLRFPVIVIKPVASFAQIINAVTYEILHQEGYNSHLTFEENFFQDLITSGQDRETFLKRGTMIGLGQDERLCAFLIQSNDEEDISAAVCSFCRSQWGHKCYTLSKNSRVMVAVRLTISEVSKRFVLELAEELLAKLEEVLPPHTFQMGIGRCYKDIASFNKSFFEACSALSFSMLAHSQKHVSHFSDLGVYRILFDYKNREELFQLYRDTVGVIAEYDQKNQTEYLNTIRTYFGQNYSINNTAKKMFVHYNTILYRLNKIKILFGIDLGNEEDRINLYVSLRASDSQNLWKTF